MMMDHDVAYWEDPSQVIWVDLGHRRLQGMDWFFVGSRSYGMWNDPRNRDVYEGRMSVGFWFIDGVETEMDVFVIPPRAVVYEGYMLTDEQARFVGLIN